MITMADTNVMLRQLSADEQMRMEAHYREIGGELLTETKAEHLLFEDGRVTGANCSTPNGTLVVHADAVVLATGGYGASVALRNCRLCSYRS